MAQTESEIVQGIGSDYGTKYGFSNPDEAKDYFFKSGRGLSHELVDGRDRLRQHFLLHQADRESGEFLGGPAR